MESTSHFSQLAISRHNECASQGDKNSSAAYQADNVISFMVQNKDLMIEMALDTLNLAKKK